MSTKVDVELPDGYEKCPEPACALPAGHASAFHVPLLILWQRTGHIPGPMGDKDMTATPTMNITVAKHAARHHTILRSSLVGPIPANANHTADCPGCVITWLLNELGYGAAIHDARVEGSRAYHELQEGKP